MPSGSRYFYWFLYRRRNRFTTILIVVFLLLCFVYLNSNSKSSDQGKQHQRPKRNPNERKIRINRETYTTPEPCHGCPGENGGGVSLTVIGYKTIFSVLSFVFLQANESKDLQQILAKEFFNLRASDKISLWRSIPDTRDSECRSVQYPKDLPSASVVIVFKNERWSPVLRTVYSVLNRSPKELLKEVILVDDQSDIGTQKLTFERKI